MVSLLDALKIFGMLSGILTLNKRLMFSGGVEGGFRDEG